MTAEQTASPHAERAARRCPEPVLGRTEARRFVGREIRPYVETYDAEGQIPDTLLEAAGTAGLWAPFLPVDSGGLGLSFGTLGEIHEEIGRGCSSLRSLLTVHGMVCHALYRWGSAEQRSRWLPELAAGRLRGALCVSEPEVGSDATAVAATAVRQDDGWVLDGTKTWITGGQSAGLFLVFARTAATVTAFLVPRQAPGVRVEPIDGMLGTRASMLATVRFDAVTLGPEALVGPEAFSSGMVLSGVLDLGRFSVAAGAVGILQACLDACAEYSTSREVGSTALREFQLIRAKISDMVTDTAAARLLCQEAGRLKDAGDSGTIMATMIAKHFASTAAARHASEAVQIHGARGCAPYSATARHYRDAKVMEIVEGSSEIQRLSIADAAYRTAV